MQVTGGRVVGYSEWNDGLCDWFFRPDQHGQPVYLSCDPTMLAAVAEVQGWALDDPVADLLAAVRSRIGRGDLLDPWIREAFHWRRAGSEGAPPWVAILAVTVLAAVGSQAAPGLIAGDRAYYRPLRLLLGLSPGGIPPGFDNDIAVLWSLLRDWLDDHLHGSCGRSTAVASSHLPNVGWALSQTVLNATERARLPGFFRAIGAEPGEDIGSDVLLACYLRWAARHAGHSARRDMFERGSPAAALLAGALHQLLLAWDGRSRDERGRTTLPLLLTYYSRDGALRLATQVAPGFADRSVVVGGEAVQLGPLEELVLLAGDPAEALAGRPLLGHLAATGLGTHPTGPAFPMRLPATDVHVLATNDQLGMWVEVNGASFGREHVLVVRAAAAAAVEQAMTDLGSDVIHLSRARLPAGWCAYQRFEPSRPAVVAAHLTPLLPTGVQLAHLTGGLPINLRARIWLSGGEPDVALPDVDDRTGQVLQLDGVELDWPPHGPLHLRGRSLASGAHELVLAGRVLRFTLVEQAVDQDGHGDARRTVDRRSGQQILTFSTGLGAPSTSAPGAVALPVPVQVAVCGALVTALNRSADPLEPVARHQLLAGGCYYVLGNPGQAARVRPTAPHWLRLLVPPFHAREADLEGCLAGLGFRPRWLVRVPARGLVTVAEISSVDADPGPPPAAQPRAAPAPWAQVLPLLERVEVDGDEAGPWAEYLDAARDLGGAAAAQGTGRG